MYFTLKRLPHITDSGGIVVRDRVVEVGNLTARLLRGISRDLMSRIYSWESLLDLALDFLAEEYKLSSDDLGEYRDRFKPIVNDLVSTLRSMDLLYILSTDRVFLVGVRIKEVERALKKRGFKVKYLDLGKDLEKASKRFKDGCVLVNLAFPDIEFLKALELASEGLEKLVINVVFPDNLWVFAGRGGALPSEILVRYLSNLPPQVRAVFKSLTSQSVRDWDIHYKSYLVDLLMEWLFRYLSADFKWSFSLLPEADQVLHVPLPLEKGSEGFKGSDIGIFERDYRVDPLRDPLFGIISELETKRLDHIGAFLTKVRIADTEPIYGAKNYRSAAGIDFLKENSEVKAIGEGLERYSAAVIRDVKYLPIGELAGRVSHELLGAYSHMMVRELKEEVALTSVRGVLSGKIFEVPADWVFLVRKPSSHRGMGYWQHHSTGLACHRSLEEAILKGLEEVIERHVLFTSWVMGNMRYVPLDFRRYFEGVGFLGDDLELKVWEVDNPYNLRVVFALVRSVKDRAGKGIVATGTASGVSLRLAVEKAVLEAFHNLVYLREVISGLSSEELTRVKLRYFHKYHDHLIYYSFYPEKLLARLGELERVEARWIEEGFEGEDRGFKERVRSFMEVSLSEPLYKELTTGDVGALGFRVVRVIVPSLLPLPINDHFLKHPHPFP